MSFQSNTSAQPIMPAPIVGNFFAAVYGAPSFDYVYCLIAQPAETTPSIVTLRRTDSSDTTSQISSFSSGYGHRDSKIAANRRDFSETSQQSSIFYQGYNGNLFEWRIDKNGGRAHIGVNTVPETTSNSVIAPVMGSSLASVTTGQDYQTAFLFYQAPDNRIYYVYQKAFGQWSIPSLVTYDPAMARTTFSAFSWTETDPYTGTDTVDCVCIMYNQAPGRYVVHMRRELRNGLNVLIPKFEPVSGFNGPVMRGPFATVHMGAQNSVDSNQYRLFSQPQEDPSRLFQGQVSQGGNFLDMSLVPNTTGVRTPARGTSIAIVYNPSNSDNTKRSIRVFYSTPEGRLLYSTMYDDSDIYNSLQHGELQRPS